MNDRELLEAAARAAGINGEWERDPNYLTERWAFMVPYNNQNLMTAFEWNPLRENSDALPLAVKKRMRLQIDDYGAAARIGDKGMWHGFEAHMHGGIEAATRRAIVRCAAASLGQEAKHG